MAEDTRSGEVPPSVSGADIRTFLFADMRGYTRFTQEHGDEAASLLAGKFAGVVRATVPEFGGELLELRGDEALCVFGSARQALRAAIELQRRLRIPDACGEVFPLGVGVGLDAGEAVPTEGGYRGGALNVASRLCALAVGGEVLAAETVVALARRVDGLRFQSRRTVRMKGVAEPVRLVEVVSEQPLPPVPVVPRTHRYGRGTWTVLAFAALLVAVGGVVVALTSRHAASASHAGVLVRPNSVAVIDPRSGQVVADVRVGHQPVAVAAGYHAVWVANTSDSTITRIDPTTLAVHSTGVAVTPADLAVGANLVVVYDGGTASGVAFDPTLQSRSTFRVPRHCTITAGPGLCTGGGLAIGGGHIWVASGREDPQGPPTVWEINPHTLQIQRAIPRIYAERLTWGLDHLWAYGSAGMRAAVIDPKAHTVVRFSLPAPAVYNSPEITTADGTGWAVSPTGVGVFVLDPSGGVQRTVPLPAGLFGATAARGSVWITSGTGSVYQVSAYTKTLQHTYHLHHPAAGLALAYGRLWVAID